MVQLLQIFLRMKLVRHLADVGEALTETYDPACAVSVNIDVLYGMLNLGMYPSISGQFGSIVL